MHADIAQCPLIMNIFLKLTYHAAKKTRHGERGNMLFMIFLAVVLIGLLSAAVLNSGDTDGSNIDNENLAIKASEVQRYAAELERAVLYIIRQNSKSENDIRFAHPDNNAEYGDLSADSDPSDQVFHSSGGAANYRTPPTGINDGSPWEFYGSTAIPGAGSSRADLVAVLPNVTQQFCERINLLNGQTSAQPVDTGGGTASGASAGDCINAGAAGRFDNGQQFYATPNTMDESSFTQIPALQACVQCTGITGTPYEFYHVILAR